MSFDAVVTNPGRLRILTALAVEERQEFVQLRRVTQLTDGNLSAHARRLESAGLVGIDKQFRAGKPVTSFVLTTAGRAALEAHTRRLLAAISHRRVAGTSSDASRDNSSEGIRPLTKLPVVRPSIPNQAAVALSETAIAVEAADDWID